MARIVRRTDLDGNAAKTVLLPGTDEGLRAFVTAASPIPVHVVANPRAALGPSDLAVLVVDDVGPPLRAAATRVLTEGVPYVVLVHRDAWGSGSAAVQKLLDEVQQDPRRKLIRFWRDRSELERTLREEVLALDACEFVGQTVGDGSFVKVGSTFEQVWELENTGFCAWNERALRESAAEQLTSAEPLVPIAHTEPGARVTVTAAFTAPAEPASCRSVWQMVDADGRVCLPWSTGLWCQVLAVY